VVQYANDTLLIVQADSAQLQYFKALINDFAMSTDLKVIFNKSLMIPINVADDKISSLAADFSCQIGSMPFTNLGLPMGTTKPRFQDLTPIIDRIERRLSACSSLLSYTGRLQMVNSVLTPTGAVNTKNWYMEETDLWAEFGRRAPFGKRFSSKHSVKASAVGSTSSFGRRAVSRLKEEAFGNA
jgi:hypothetical protein